MSLPKLLVLYFSYCSIERFDHLETLDVNHDIVRDRGQKELENSPTCITCCNQKVRAYHSPYSNHVDLESILLEISLISDAYIRVQTSLITALVFYLVSNWYCRRPEVS